MPEMTARHCLAMFDRNVQLEDQAAALMRNADLLEQVSRARYVVLENVWVRFFGKRP
jgi:hypothetical protein